jgi:hypothetical protein
MVYGDNLSGLTGNPSPDWREYSLARIAGKDEVRPERRIMVPVTDFRRHESGRLPAACNKEFQ